MKMDEKKILVIDGTTGEFQSMLNAWLAEGYHLLPETITSVALTDKESRTRDYKFVHTAILMKRENGPESQMEPYA